MRADARRVVRDVLPENVIRDSGVLMFGPPVVVTLFRSGAWSNGDNLLSKRVGPALAHTAGLVGLQASACPAAGHAVRDTVSVFVGYDVVF